MTDDARVLAKATGFGPSLSPIQGRSAREPVPAAVPPVDKGALQPVYSAPETARRARMQQASPASQSSVGSDYRWATLNVEALIGGHTFPAGTRIAVAPSQTQKSGGGKAHTTSIVTRVWAKFGQTFDASSWVTGWLAANLFSYTGQKATWSNSTGFGAPVYSSSMNDRDVLTKALGLGPDLSPMSARGYRPPPPVPRAVQSPLEYASTPTQGGGYRPPLKPPTIVQSPAELNQSPDAPTTSALTLPTQSMPPTQGAPTVSIKAPKKLHNIPLYRVSAIQAPMTSCASHQSFHHAWWFEDPPSVQWTIKTYYGVFLFGNCDNAFPSGGGVHGFKKGTELWVSNQTMTTTWYHYPVKNQFNTVSFYRVYRVAGQPVIGWVMQQTVGSLAGLFPSGTAGLPAGVGALASSDHERVLHRALASLR